MIRRDPITPRKEPNYKCKVRDMDGVENTWVTHADSEDELRQRLKGMSFDVIDISSYDFSKWKVKAAKVGQEAIDAHQRGQKPHFPPFWSELKGYIFELFDGKCAYCESAVQHVAAGDVEHYRPKKRVKEDPSHPGYYWLAYDVKNLLPCCEKCNRARGKMNHFPIQGSRARRPEDDLSREKPELLNPYEDSPEKHLRFAVAIAGKKESETEGEGEDFTCVGTVKGITDIGEKSRKTYHLNRRELVEKRKEEQENVVKDLSLFVIEPDLRKFKSVMDNVRRGVRQYSAAALAQTLNWCQVRKAAMEKGLIGL